MIVEFDWPPKELSPNWRGHWSKKAKAAKKYRADCYVLALKAGAGKFFAQKEVSPLSLCFTFMPPDNRRYDYDNLVARMKAGLDGLADALSINDNLFRIKAIGFDSDGTGKVRITVL